MVTLGDHIDFFRIDSESIFLEKRKLIEFAHNQFEKTKPDHYLYRYEAIVLRLGDPKKYYEREIFGTSGKLLKREVLNKKGYYEEVHSEFVSVAVKTGDICVIASNIENPHSSYTVERIGFIGGVDKRDKDIEFTIYFLNHEGFLGHFHTCKPGVKKVIVKPTTEAEKIVFISAMFFFDWQNGNAIEDSVCTFLNGDASWYQVPKLISLMHE